MDDHKNSIHQEEKRAPEQPARLSAEQGVLLTTLICFIIFLWIIVFLFFPLLSNRPVPIAIPPAILEAASKQGFVLPPTWTPAPTQKFVPTPIATYAYDGTVPTRIYTPRATSLPGAPFPFVPEQIAVIDLARILQGESPGDKEAAYYVGWVAKNRLLHPGYGNTYAIVSHGFFGYRADIRPTEEFIQIARRIIRGRNDPTRGCLYALSRTDITKLGIPPHRADVTKGEWFFFRTWPLSGL